MSLSKEISFGHLNTFYKRFFTGIRQVMAPSEKKLAK